MYSSMPVRFAAGLKNCTPSARLPRTVSKSWLVHASRWARASATARESLLGAMFLLLRAVDPLLDLNSVEIRRHMASRESGLHAHLATTHRRFVVAHQELPTSKSGGEIDQGPFRFSLFMQRHSGCARRQPLQPPVEF